MLVTLYVPRHLNNSQTVPANTLQRIEEEILESFGGFTRADSVGVWQNKRGRVFHEPVWVYSILTDNVEAQAIAANIALDVRNRLHQESVLFTVSKVYAEVVTGDHYTD